MPIERIWLRPRLHRIPQMPDSGLLEQDRLVWSKLSGWRQAGRRGSQRCAGCAAVREESVFGYRQKTADEVQESSVDPTS